MIPSLAAGGRAVRLKYANACTVSVVSLVCVAGAAVHRVTSLQVLYGSSYTLPLCVMCYDSNVYALDLTLWA